MQIYKQLGCKSKMKVFWILICVVVFSGCTRRRDLPPLTVNSAKPIKPQLITTLTNSLENSRTFLELRYRAKKPMIFIEEEMKGWAQVDIGELSQDFFHRWATLKVETKTGRILRLSTDKNLEDEWLVEYQPRIWRSVRW